MSDKLNFIVNPNAGRGRALKAIKQIKKILEIQAIPYTIAYAPTSADAKFITTSLEQDGEKIIIAIGGDGTLSEVFNAVKNPADITFGFIPAGTGNDFAKTLGISQNPKKALEHILSNKIKQIDYLQGVNRRALNTISTGIDVKILQKYNSYKKKNKFKYYIALFSTVFNFIYPKFKIQTDELQQGEYDCFIVAACNGKYFGGGMKISPNSIADDGKINFIRITSMKKSKIFGCLLSFLKGKHITKPYAKEFLCENIQINEDTPLTIEFDGELIENEPFNIKLIKSGLNLLYDENLTTKKPK